MRVCLKCGKEYDDAVQKCTECDEETVTTLETQEVEKEGDAETSKTFCIYCGGQIVPEGTYCVKCGRSPINCQEKYCINCGALLQQEQKFCAKCGYRVNNIVLPRGLDAAAKTVKKINWKKTKKIALLFIASIALILVGKAVWPKVFVPVEKYLEQGEYEKAYKKAKKEKKEDVLVENLIAKICAGAKEDLKNSDSFKLREAWYVKEDNRIVLRIQGTNSYGGEVNSYWYYTFSEEKQEYQLWTTVSDFEEEETYSWDELEEKLEKILKNAAKEIVQEIVNDDSKKLDVYLVKRINRLNSKDILGEVELIEETKTLYPLEESKDL